MVLGRTDKGLIKIKTDEEGGGLRAVNCACCGPFFACCDCPAVLGDWNFSVTGGPPIPFTDGGNEQTIVTDCEDGGGPRVCNDIFDAFGEGEVTPSGTAFNFAAADFFRSGTNLSNCGWDIRLLAYFEIFDTVTLNGPDGETEVVDDWPFYSTTDPDPPSQIFIPGNSPTGTFSLITQSYPSPNNIPEGWTISAPSHSYEYTFSISAL